MQKEKPFAKMQDITEYYPVSSSKTTKNKTYHYAIYQYLIQKYIDKLPSVSLLSN
jgi:hypothetical protein